MRIRTIGAAATAAALTILALIPAGASARAGYGLSIVAAPNPIVAGDAMLIYGKLSNSSGKPVGNQRVVLWHRVNPSPVFRPVQSVRTDARGFYEFTRADGVVVSNRNWFVVADGTRSRTVHERVFAQLTLMASAASTPTNTPVLFTGMVAANHAGERVLLQRQVGPAGDDWRRIGVGVIGPGGAYSISHVFRRADELGAATIRTVFPGDARNLRTPSNPVELAIEQAQNPNLTLAPSSPTIIAGQSVTLSGKLITAANGLPVAGQVVTLLAHADGQPYAPVATIVTGPDGSFSFSQSPVNNTVYKVRAGGRESAQVFEGVHDVVSIATSTTSATVGQTIQISGTVAPNKTNHIIYLQLRNTSGDFQSIQSTFVGPNSHYVFNHQLVSPGLKTYRVLITGGPENLGAASQTVQVNVAPAPAAALTPQTLTTPTPMQ
jgi:hypothetical protein